MLVIPIFIVFSLTRLRIEHQSIASVEDVLKTQLLIGLYLTCCFGSHSSIFTIKILHCLFEVFIALMTAYACLPELRLTQLKFLSLHV